MIGGSTDRLVQAALVVVWYILRGSELVLRGQRATFGGTVEMVQKHILVVEDDEALLNGVCDLLEVEGYKVSSAPDGARRSNCWRPLTAP